MTSTVLNLPDKFHGELPKIQDMFNDPILDETSKETISGKEFLAKSIECLIVELDKQNIREDLSNKELLHSVAKVYDTLYNNYLGILDHYFRYIYNILKFVDNSQIEDKKLYADLLQAQLSKDELGILFYNGIGQYGIKKMHPLLEKYNFLENLNISSLSIHGKTLIKLYPYTTFKFLAVNQKMEIVLKSLIDNPDNIESIIRIEKYYLMKYNLSNQEIEFLCENFKETLLDKGLFYDKYIL